MIGLDQAIDIIDEGLLVVYPTETVYGIGASISSQEAVDWVYEVKGTPEGTPFPVAVSSLEMARDIVIPNHEDVLKRYLPGPFTFILPSATDFGWNGYIGLRIDIGRRRHGRTPGLGRSRMPLRRSFRRHRSPRRGPLHPSGRSRGVRVRPVGDRELRRSPFLNMIYAI